MADQSYFTDDDVISALDKSYKLRNELASKAGKPDAMQDKNLEIGLGDASAAITGSLLSNVGTGIKEASIGDMTRATRKVADGSFVKGAVDAAVSGITDKSSEELSKKGLLTDALGLDGVGFVGIDPSENPVKEAASTFLNKAADTGEYVADKLDSYAVKPVAEVVGGGVKAAGDGIKDWMSDDAKEAAKSSAYTQDESGDFHLGNMWSDPARASIKLLDSIGSMGGTVVAGLLTGGAVKGMVMRTMLKRGASEGIAKQTAEMAAQKWSERAVAGEAMSMSVGQAADQSRESYGQLSDDDKLNSPIFGDTVKSVYEQHPELSSSQRMAIVDEQMRDKMASFAKSDPSTYAAAAAGTMLGDSMLFKMVTGKAGASEVTGGLLSRTAQGFAKGGLGEGVGEAVEEGVQQNVQNRASNAIGGTNIDPMQGVALAAAEAGTMGALTGGAVGSISSVAHGSSKPVQPSESPEQQVGDTQTLSDATQPADLNSTAPVVEDAPDMETAINEVYSDDVQTKVPGSFSIGKDESGYRAAYVDDNGELQVSEPYATPDEAQKIVTGGQVIRQDVSQTIQPTNETQQSNEGAETTQPLEVEPQTAIDGQDQAATEANQQLPVDGPQNINALQAELPAIPTQPEQAPTNSNDIFGQLTTVRVTKRGNPFASQKEARLASRKTETPIELPTGGFGVVDKTELEQVQASQNQQLIATPQADVNDTNVADINPVADPVDVNESMSNQVVAQNQQDINVNEQPVSQTTVKQSVADIQAPSHDSVGVIMPDGSETTVGELSRQNEQQNTADSTKNEQVNTKQDAPVIAKPELPWTGYKEKHDGTMLLEGDSTQLSEWAKSNNVLAIKSKSGVIVGKKSASVVKDIIAKNSNETQASETTTQDVSPQVIAEKPWKNVTDKADGTMVMEGDPVQLREWAKQNNITAIKSKTGIVVGKNSVPAVKDIIAKSNVPTNAQQNEAAPTETPPGQPTEIIAPPQPAEAEGSIPAASVPWTNSIDKPDGTMILEGDPVVLKAWAKDNGITAIKSKNGVVVGKSSVQTAKDFISKQQEPGNVTSNGQLSTVPGTSDVAASNNTGGGATVGELVTGEQSGNANSAITDANNAEAAVVEPGRNGRDNALTNQEVLQSKSFDTADKGGFSLSTMPKNEAEISGKGMTKPGAEVVAKQWLRQFKTDINVAVVKDQAEFESALADRGFANSIQSGEMDNAAYLPDSKTILINASAIQNPKRLKQIMRHEILVHHGLRYVVGEEAYAKIMNAIAKGYETSPEIRNAVDTVTKNYADKDMFTQMEEAFAHYAENIPADSGPVGRLWQRIVSMVKSALQKVNFISVNESEQQLDSVLHAIAKNMRKGVEDGVLAERSSEALFSKKSHADIASVDGSQLGAVEKILKLSGNRLINFVKEQRGYALGTLSDRQIDQVYKGVTGGAVSRYQKLRTQMEADRNDILLDAETRIDPLWSALKKDSKAALSNLMHDATMSKLHPDIPLADNTWYQEAKTRLYKARKPETKALYQQELDVIKENYKNLSERYKLTSKEGKDLYQVMKETYNKQWEDLRNAIEQRIDDVMGEGGKAISAELRLKMEQSLKHGPYFPLARFGDYVVRAKKGDQFIREHFEKRRDAERAMQSYQSDGYKSTMTVKEEKTGGSATAHDLGMKVMELLDNAKNENSDPSQLKDSVWQAMLEVLPDASYAKHAIHRKRIKGASRDGHRAFLNSVYHYAFHVSKIRYGHKMKAELDQMNDYLQATLQGEPSAIKEVDLEVAQQVLNEMYKRHELNMNPKGSSIAGAMGNIGFLWYLGASPASAVINLTQNAMVMLPQLAGKFGYTKSAKFMLKAMSDYARHGVFKKGTKEAWVSLTRATKGISSDEKAMLNELYRAGVLDLTQAHSVAARADTDQQNISKSSVFSQKAMQLSGAMFHNAEVLNREVAALTAYRLLKEQQPNLSNEAALDQVTDMVYDGHGDYAASNRPRYMRGDVAKVLTQFKIYSQMMTYTLTRNAILSAKSGMPMLKKISGNELTHDESVALRDGLISLKTLGAMLGHTLIMAGAMGLPTPISLLLYGIAAAFDDDDDRTAEASFRLGLSEAFGPDVGELIAKGPINSITGLSIADRTGLGDLWWRSAKEGAEGDDLVFHYLQQVAGPALGIGISAARGLRSFADGDIQRGVEAISPKAIKDIAKAHRQSSEGERTRNGDSIIDDVPAWNIAMQSMGFSSAKMSQVYAARGYIKGKEKVIEDERSNLLADFFDAKRSGDEEVMRDVMERIKAFNSKHDRAETITGRTLMQSIKSRNRSMERTQAGVYLSKKREYLRGEGAFLDDEDDDE